MNRSHIKWVFYAACIGVVMSVYIRGRFDGIAFLFAIIGASTVSFAFYFEAFEYDKKNKEDKHDIDRDR